MELAIINKIYQIQYILQPISNFVIQLKILSNLTMEQTKFLELFIKNIDKSGFYLLTN